VHLPQYLEQRRRDLGLSKAVVAARARLSLPTVNRILAGKERRLTLDSVEAIARVLGVVVRLGAAVGFEEAESVFELRKKQATSKARRLVGLLQGTMGLEAQAVGPDELDEMVQQTACELMAGSSRKLWED
jgi:transcriptional regulator with XRE-family HTH domain